MINDYILKWWPLIKHILIIYIYIRENVFSCDWNGNILCSVFCFMTILFSFFSFRLFSFHIFIFSYFILIKDFLFIFLTSRFVFVSMNVYFDFIIKSLRQNKFIFFPNICFLLLLMKDVDNQIIFNQKNFVFQRIHYNNFD